MEAVRKFPFCFFNFYYVVVEYFVLFWQMARTRFVSMGKAEELARDATIEAPAEGTGRGRAKGHGRGRGRARGSAPTKD